MILSDDGTMVSKGYSISGLGVVYNVSAKHAGLFMSTRRTDSTQNRHVLLRSKLNRRV